MTINQPSLTFTLQHNDGTTNTTPPHIPTDRDRETQRLTRSADQNRIEIPDNDVLVLRRSQRANPRRGQQLEPHLMPHLSHQRVRIRRRSATAPCNDTTPLPHALSCSLRVMPMSGLVIQPSG